jgi:hypothetical protein
MSLAQLVGISHFKKKKHQLMLLFPFHSLFIYLIAANETEVQVDQC